MKLTVLLLALVATLPTRSFASIADVPTSDELVPFTSRPAAAVGMSRLQVVEQFGEPAEKISPIVWLYVDFRASNRPAHERSDALLVVFMGERVSRLRLVKQADVQLALAKLRASKARAAAADAAE
jgi:hypothetical protein